MRITRIADNAISIYISNKDLESRNLDASNLKEGSKEFDKLVWDAIDHANIEFGHEFDDRQLSVVNKPDGNGGIVLTISHYSESAFGDEEYIQSPEADLSNRFGKLFMDSFNANRLASSSSEEDEETEDYDGDDDEYEDEDSASRAANINERHASQVNSLSPEDINILLGKVRLMRRDMQSQKTSSGSSSNGSKKTDERQRSQQRAISPVKFPVHDRKNTAVSDWDILIFPEMNDMLEFLAHNKSFKSIASSLYTYRGAYYLVLKPNGRNINTLNRLESLVIDYNATYLPAESFLPLLKERGTVLMETGAISKLIKNFEL